MDINAPLIGNDGYQFEARELFADYAIVRNQYGVRLSWAVIYELFDAELLGRLDYDDVRYGDATHQAFYDLYCLIFRNLRGDDFFPDTITAAEAARLRREA